MLQTEHQVNNPPPGDSAAGKLLNILTGILVVMFPVGFFIMFTDIGKEYLWTTTIFLGLEALITFIILVKTADLLSVVITTAVIFLASWFIEYWGVTTGFPFGDYSYTATLLPLIGGVPLAIMFAWFTVSACALLTARYLLNGSSEIAAIAAGAVFILGTDILLEPFASFINGFWLWDDGVIPIQNFISWFAVGLIFLFTFSQLIKWNEETGPRAKINRIPLLITAINIINFSILNLAHGYYVLTITGIVIFLVITASVTIFGKPSPGSISEGSR